LIAKIKIYFMRCLTLLINTAAMIVTVSACNNADKTAAENAGDKKTPVWKEENITYTDNTTTMNGYVVFDSADAGKRPAVIVVHEWWGMNDYTKMRARELAKLGYVAMAIDVFGNGKTADNPDSAGKYAMPFYQNPQMAKARIDAAVEKIKTYGMVDTSNIGAIGYCFGGGILLNTVRLGDYDLKGIVSFHGSLIGTPPNRDLLKSKILVCHGNDDKFVSAADVVTFKKQMDSIGAAYTFKGYDGATHAFTNPNATAMGEKFKLPIAYNAAADTASWNEMKSFFSTLFK
jgi:dienelactone hydrolase